MGNQQLRNATSKGKENIGQGPNQFNVPVNTSIGFYAPDNNSFVDVDATKECKQVKESIFIFP